MASIIINLREFQTGDDENILVNFKNTDSYAPHRAYIIAKRSVL